MLHKMLQLEASFAYIFNLKLIYWEIWIKMLVFVYKNTIENIMLLTANNILLGIRKCSQGS